MMLPTVRRCPLATLVAICAVMVGALATACGGGESTSSAAAGTAATTAAAGRAVTFVGAGDIAGSGRGAAQTAALIERIPGTVFTTGDNAYPDGTARNYADYYGPTWGRFKARTRPVPGNHEYNTGNADAYFRYFGRAAGPAGRGYYSYDLGSWHVVALNSNCDKVSCAADSPQVRWLRADLAAHRSRCTVALWHHPRFSSGNVHGDQTMVAPFWDALYQYHATLVLNGHDHIYERFARQSPSGAADPRRGIREFIVGTGGESDYGIGTVQPNSEVRKSGTFGVLRLTLRPGGYSWRFVPVAGSTFTDQGTGTC
jgi:hypothetical protein